jgi:phosphoglycolate phosphatase
MKKLIFYDLDGTLVDTRLDIVRSAQHMLAEMNAPQLEPHEIQRYVGRGLYHLVGLCLKTEDMKRIEKGGKIYRQYYSEHMMDNSRLYPDAREILDYFKSRKQAVVTNKPNPFAKDMLAQLGVADYFTDIIAGDSEYPKKPSAAALLAIMKRENTAPADTLFIGDSLVDIETARNAGVEAAVVLHGFNTEDELQSAHPDLMAKDFTDLREKIKLKGW